MSHRGNRHSWQVGYQSPPHFPPPPSTPLKWAGLGSGSGQSGVGQASGLGQGSGVGSRNNAGNNTVTALCIAAAVGDVECVRALLRAGANPSIPCYEHAFLITGSSSHSTGDSSGNDKMLTPREFARKGKHEMAVVALLEHQQQHKLPLTRLQPPPRPQKKKPS